MQLARSIAHRAAGYGKRFIGTQLTEAVLEESWDDRDLPGGNLPYAISPRKCNGRYSAESVKTVMLRGTDYAVNSTGKPSSKLSITSSPLDVLKASPKASATFTLSAESIAVSTTCSKTAGRLLLSNLVLRPPSNGPPISASVFKDFHKAFQRADIPDSTPDSSPSSAGYPMLPTLLSADMRHPFSQGTPAPNNLMRDSSPVDDLDGFLEFDSCLIEYRTFLYQVFASF
ncbi:hypothetical protein G7K_3793-t1 [Saitoella complicata NRRL Y-17804]|uniref:Uncharacterized protein n=1 Tax=Saitoella complicata (strain BCRC 22490 / CBS 7301 / JCM 7358 / NBRC 10748 / NRRL Y-17804) TaxID=698492 RepID=A0A0E9NIH1_SAICN|nr:hypothetical protein G7K_3793-t1 [Saitoella complicata NRRL Y-17804]